MGNRWENKIKDSLEDFTLEEPQGLWAGVESGLRPSTRAFSPVLAAGIALAVAASFAIVGIFLFKENSTETAPALAVVKESAALPAEESVATLADEGSAGLLADAGRVVQLSVPKPVSASAAEQSLSAGDSEASPKMSARVAEPVEDMAAKPEDAEVQESATVSNEGQMSLENLLAVENTRKSKHRSRLSLSLAYAGSGSKTNKMEGYSGFNCSALAVSLWNAGEAPESARRYSRVLQANINREVGTTVVHRQPLQLAFTAEYKLPQGVGIETGLVYSRLVSELTSGTEVTNYKTIQTLDYLGLPLSLNFSFVDTKQHRLYLSAGAMFEKCVSGKSYTDYYYMDSGHDGETKSIALKPVQWSANLSLGYEVGIFKPVKLYFEPGLRFNFESDTPVETIYSERTLNFNLRCGLRFSL